MKRSTERILTTHVGSLPRPPDLIELLLAKDDSSPGAQRAFRERVRTAVGEVVERQVAAGIDVVSDGEMAKSSFVHYVRDRVQGFEGVSTRGPALDLHADFPGYAVWRTPGGTVRPSPFASRPVCTAPLAWNEANDLAADIDNFKAALASRPVAEAFMPCASIGIIAQRMDNAYYPSYEAFVGAIAEVMKEEYRTITDAGLLIQIDAPEMGIDRALPPFRDQPIVDFRARMELWVEAINHALSGIDPARVRFHVCWGNVEGPHTQDVPLREIVDIVLKVNAGAYSVEASNPRHAHEWKVWRDVRLPEGKVLIPGVIDSVTNFVEHPELVADRIITFAGVVGRENVIAGTDCGFGTAAVSANVYPPIVWAKLRSLAEGAALASAHLWSR
ncbi:MAG: cobalamin-independent methionine synthase II family protein [Dehalococcoidia bacterium]